MRKLHVLGTGTAVVTKYLNTAFVLDNGQDYFLVDGMGGAEILRQFDHMGLDWTKVHYAFLSHEHTDHFLGMVWVLRYIAFQMCEDRYDGDFHLYCHAELADKLRMVCRALLRKVECDRLDERIHFHLIRDGEREQIWGCDFSFFDIRSTKAKQFGFQMTWPDEMKLVFPGDEPVNDACRPYCQDADWLLSEAFCLYADREIFTPYKYHHSTVREASLLAQDCQAKNLILWHTEDATFGTRKTRYTEEAKQFYDGNVFVPEDGEVIELPEV
nr:MBL fold metallo-hydrolase [Massilistercora timonensis]